MNIIGLSAFYHESACCLLQDGKLIAAAAEERFTRIKHDARLPIHAFRACLEAGGIQIHEVDCLAYYENPAKKYERQLAMEKGKPSAASDPRLPEILIRQHLGYEGPIETFDHHRSHAASAFYLSGFENAAVLTVDGVGEWATTTYGSGDPSGLRIFEEVRFPHSLGLLYATITAYLGFRVNRGEYKVMGLAAYGRPAFLKEMRELIVSEPGGQFSLNMEFFDFIAGETMFASPLIDLFGHPPRVSEGEISPFHEDVARSLQQTLEEILLEKVDYLSKEVDSPNLCLAGGVALNCVANARIRREGPFNNIYIPPAPGDAGACIGAAHLAHRMVSPTPTPRHSRPNESTPVLPFLGPRFNIEQVRRLIANTGIEALDFQGSEPALLEAAAERLAANKIVGWFQGGMEFGPRALGNRSILANPQDLAMQARVNARIKKREAFRPFAPSVLLHHTPTHFDLDHPSPYMLETCQVISPRALPAITHVDGSARPQTVTPEDNPRFAALLEAFYRRTGCPVLLNTSFNERGQPIVCTPVDALMAMIRTGLDCLVLGDFLIDRGMVPDNLGALLEAWGPAPWTARADLDSNLYSFV